MENNTAFVVIVLIVSLAVTALVGMGMYYDTQVAFIEKGYTQTMLPGSSFIAWIKQDNAKVNMRIINAVQALAQRVNNMEAKINEQGIMGEAGK